MKISARNQLKCTVRAIQPGSVMAEVRLELADGQQIVSAITANSVKSLNLQPGDTVFAIIKSTEVMVGKE